MAAGRTALRAQTVLCSCIAGARQGLRVVDAGAGPSRGILARRPNTSLPASARSLSNSAAFFKEGETAKPRRGRPPQKRVDAEEQTAAAAAPKPVRARRGRPPAKSKTASPEASASGSAAGRTTKDQRRSSVDTASSALTNDPALNELFSHPHLPPPAEWGRAFPGHRVFMGSRYVVANKNTAHDIVNSLGLDKLAAKGIKTTVIEGYPGPGTLTRELLLHPAVEKVIAMEDNKLHLEFLENLQADPELGPKLTIIRKSSYFWPSYDEILEGGHLDHLKDRIRTSTGEPANFSPEAWNEPVTKDDPNWQADSPLLFLAQLPSSVYGDQLFVQIVLAIAMRRWLFRFTRLRLAFTMNRAMANRIAAPPGTSNYTRTSAVVQTMTDLIPHALSSDDAFEPYENHFFPSRQPVGARVLISGHMIPNHNMVGTASKLGISLVQVEPKKQVPVPPDLFEVFEYLTRQMFILRAKTVEESMKALCPGAENVLRMLNTRGQPEERIDPTTSVAMLTAAQWVGLSRMFKLWPFRPKILLETGRSEAKVVEDVTSF